MQCLVFLWSSASDPGSPLQAWSPVTLTLPRKPKRRRLKLLALNCNGPKSQTKKAELHGIIDLHSPDIVIGCELKLDSSIPFYSIFPDSYTIYTGWIDRNMVAEFSLLQNMILLPPRRPTFKLQIVKLSGYPSSFQELKTPHWQLLSPAQFRNWSNRSTRWFVELPL